MILICFGRKNRIYALIAGIIRVWFLWHHCQDIEYYDFKPTDFCLAVTETDSSYENFVCAIASHKQIETSEFDYMNQNGITDFTKRWNKNEVH